jgi:serine/threonine protein kinase
VIFCTQESSDEATERNSLIIGKTKPTNLLPERTIW